MNANSSILNHLMVFLNDFPQYFETLTVSENTKVRKTILIVSHYQDSSSEFIYIIVLFTFDIIVNFYYYPSKQKYVLKTFW